MAVVGPDGVDPEREALDHVVNERDRVGLVVLLVDLQGADARRIVDGGVLEAPHLAA
jgi:hypothetical protein